MKLLNDTALEFVIGGAKKKRKHSKKKVAKKPAAGRTGAGAAPAG